MNYFTAKQLREHFKFNLRDDIPDDDRFMRGTGNPHPDNKVATIIQWIECPTRNQGIGWVLSPCSS